MIVRTAAQYRLPPRAEIVPIQPVDGLAKPTARVRDFILIHGPGAVLTQHSRPAPRITVADVQAATCAHFGLEPGDMTTDCRSKRIARPRQIAMALSRQLTKRTLPEIGRMFGNRHHTTVLHAIRAVERRVGDDPDTRAARDAIAAAVVPIAAKRCREFTND